MAWVFWMIRKPRRPFFLAPPTGSLSRERRTTMRSCFSDESSAPTEARLTAAYSSTDRNTKTKLTQR
ncbi:hypothetical protein EYF80_052936 [Liparis tanakae]|uniref:Uncharacterized protein n=1 Tax=Liparis tanakae TaxID=230148 RepID=A0A4Z2F7W5_9TELE|nr:hypothetical protein EYF80_052936 [Liparis tanakae]